MLLKPTIVLDEKDVVAFNDMASARSQNVGIPSPDAQEMWKSWSETYIGILKLASSDTMKNVESMLDNIYCTPVKPKDE